MVFISVGEPVLLGGQLPSLTWDSAMILQLAYVSPTQTIENPVVLLVPECNPPLLSLVGEFVHHL